MLPEEPNFVPYSPGANTAAIVQRIHQGTTPQTLNEKALISLGAAQGNYDRIQKALRFLGLIDAEFQLTDLATKLRKATSDEYGPLLASVLQGAYEPIFVSYHPATATYADLDNAFKPYDPAGQRKNMISCFMALCREAGLAPEAAQPRRGRPVKPATPPRNKNVPPVTAPPATPVLSKGDSKTVELLSGAGSVTVTVSVGLLDLEGDDRTFVFGLIDKLREYEKAAEIAQIAIQAVKEVE